MKRTRKRNRNKRNFSWSSKNPYPHTYQKSASHSKLAGSKLLQTLQTLPLGNTVLLRKFELDTLDMKWEKSSSARNGKAAHFGWMSLGTEEGFLIARADDGGPLTSESIVSTYFYRPPESHLGTDSQGIFESYDIIGGLDTFKVNTSEEIL